MKTISFSTVIILVLILLSVSSQARQLEVKLNANEVLIYEWTEKATAHSKEGIAITDRIKTSRFSLFINKVEINKVLFTAQMLHEVEDYSNKGIVNFVDYKFPQFSHSFRDRLTTDTNKEILYKIKFQFELDLISREIKLSNRTEVLEQCHSLLVKRGYSEERRSELIDLINKKGIKEKCDLFLQPFLFLEANIDQPKIHNEKLKMDFTAGKTSEKEIELISDGDSITKNMNCTLSLQYGLMTYQRKTQIKTVVKQNFEYPPVTKMQIVEEFHLLQKSLPKPQKLIVCGHLDNPVSNQIVLKTLDKSFGSELESKAVILDKSGNFRIETRLEHKGLVVITNPNNNQNMSSPAILLYAEPGDSIHLQASIVSQKDITESFRLIGVSETVKKNYFLPKEIVFSGDRKQEAEILNKFQELPIMTSFHFVRNLWFIGSSRLDVEIYLEAIPKLNQIMVDSGININSESATYVRDELLAYIYLNLFNARSEELEHSRSLTRWNNIGPLIVSKTQETVLQSQLDTFNIHRIYNDYGIFSRKLTTEYLKYKLYRLNPVENTFLGFKSVFGPMIEPEQHIQFAKLILNGSPLYREIANRIYNNSFSSVYGFIELGSRSNFQVTKDQTFELMRNRCNDEAFMRDLEMIQSNSRKWDDSQYIPNVTLFNLQKQKTTLRSFIEKKTTIIYAIDDWSTVRYEMDEMASKFPKINFVLINEGSNFDLWKDWNNRAEPIAQQLFLQTDSVQLADLFQDKIHNFLVFNQSGERIGVEHELIPAIQLAKDSLKAPKKEINKSTLQGIIIVMAASMLFFLVLFLAYKYQMKQRLKKQTQEKRLRELQMAAIRAQMNPHFLFNSLNSVQNLIQQNRASEAHLYLSDFAGLIRKVLRNSDKEEVSLAEELEMLEQYLKLERLRFDFEYRIEVDEGIDQNLFMLPSMILQPLAENALMHGLQHKTGEKQLHIQISKIKNAIQITIEDNGIGIEEAKKLKTKSNGMGLRMNEERIQMMKEKYGGNYSFKLIDLTEKGSEGTRVEIIIPEEI
jgi:signal transduction histidine kinase